MLTLFVHLPYIHLLGCSGDITRRQTRHKSSPVMPRGSLAASQFLKGITGILADIPSDGAGGIARFLYALMGDIDVRVCWRAAHVLRRLVHLGDVATLGAIIGLYDRKGEPCYRNPDIPFYWLSARLWLFIAIDRIAAEKPEALERHGQWLFEIATDDEFPHVVIRSFVKSAVYKLVKNGYLVLDQAQTDTLEKANTSLVPRKKARQPSYNVGFERLGSPRRKGRFDFDSMDTLPHWYSSALKSFCRCYSRRILGHC